MKYPLLLFLVFSSFVIGFESTVFIIHADTWISYFNLISAIIILILSVILYSTKLKEEGKKE